MAAELATGKDTLSLFGLSDHQLWWQTEQVNPSFVTY